MTDLPKKKLKIGEETVVRFSVGDHEWVVGRAVKMSEDGDQETFEFIGPAVSMKTTKEGVKRYPPFGFYGKDNPCTCTEQCSNPCKGTCGCAACRAAYNDFLSME